LCCPYHSNYFLNRKPPQNPDPIAREPVKENADNSRRHERENRID
jgi:hypothetical protein